MLISFVMHVNMTSTKPCRNATMVSGCNTITHTPSRARVHDDMLRERTGRRRQVGAPTVGRTQQAYKRAVENNVDKAQLGQKEGQRQWIDEEGSGATELADATGARLSEQDTQRGKGP